jgi:hypothetical protein
MIDFNKNMKVAVVSGLLGGLALPGNAFACDDAKAEAASKAYNDKVLTPGLNAQIQAEVGGEVTFTFWRPKDLQDDLIAKVECKQQDDPSASWAAMNPAPFRLLTFQAATTASAGGNHPSPAAPARCW